MAATSTGTDIAAALSKRLLANNIRLRASELLTLMVDVMVVVNADAANVVADAATEIAANPARPFLPSV